MTDKKRGRPPSGLPAETTRNIRMNDIRWTFFRESLGTNWLRKKIDEEILKDSKGKP